MGGGIAAQIKKMYPHVFDEYDHACLFNKMSGLEDGKGNTIPLLGRCQLVNVPQGEDRHGTYKAIANLFGQDSFSTSKRETNYEAIYTALEDLRRQMIDHSFKSVAFPRKMSSDLAGGDWEIIRAMILSIFKDSDIDIEIIDWDGSIL